MLPFLLFLPYTASTNCPQPAVPEFAHITYDTVLTSIDGILYHVFPPGKEVTYWCASSRNYSDALGKNVTVKCALDGTWNYSPLNNLDCGTDILDGLPITEFSLQGTRTIRSFTNQPNENPRSVYKYVAAFGGSFDIAFVYLTSITAVSRLTITLKNQVTGRQTICEAASLVSSIEKKVRCKLEEATLLIIEGTDRTFQLAVMKVSSPSIPIPHQFGKHITDLGRVHLGKYLFTTQATTFYEARQVCSGIGGRLLDYKDWDELNAIKAGLSKLPETATSFWIDISSYETRWFWGNGSVVLFEMSDWAFELVSPLIPKAVFLSKFHDWQWVPVDVNQKIPTICRLGLDLKCSGELIGSPQGGRVYWVTEDKVIYQCDPGYKMDGIAERACNRGKWSGQIPTCSPY